MPSVFVMRSSPSALTPITDDFNRANGTTLVANRSDGGLWTVGPSVPWSIDTNRLIRASGSGLGTLNNDWIAAEFGAATSVVIAFDVSMTVSGGGRARVFYGKNSSGAGGYQIEMYESLGTVTLLIDGGSNLGSISGVTYTTVKRVTVTHNLLTGAWTLGITGKSTISGTGSLAGSTGTWIGFVLDRAYSANQSYYDNVSVIPS